MKAATILQLSTAKKALIGITLLCLVLMFALPGCNRPNPSDFMTKDFHDITWPDSELAQSLPEPKSKFGEIASDSADHLAVYIGKTSQKEYEDYVSACKGKGYSVDYSKSDTFYSATNEDGDDLSISYDEDGRYMDITLSTAEYLAEVKKSNEEYAKKQKEEEAAKKAEEEKKQAESSASPSSSESSSGSSSSSGKSTSFEEFKATVDSYEKTMNECCDFLEKYEDSDDAASMAADYAKYWSSYTETMEKLDALEDRELTNEEAEYLLAAQNRINERLLKLSL